MQTSWREIGRDGPVGDVRWVNEDNMMVGVAKVLAQGGLLYVLMSAW